MSERPPIDDLEHQLARFRPATPSADVMTRLRAAKPKPARAASAPLSAAPLAARRHRRPSFRLTAAAAVALVATLLWLRLPEPSRSASVASSPAPDPATVANGAGGPAPVSAGSVFLPIASSSQLVSLHPVPGAVRPDEVARPLWRAVVVDDLTAVGAETDAALHVRRAREIYLPITSPVY